MSDKERTFGKHPLEVARQDLKIRELWDDMAEFQRNRFLAWVLTGHQEERKRLIALRCPMCGRDHDPEHIENVRHHYESDGQFVPVHKCQGCKCWARFERVMG